MKERDRGTKMMEGTYGIIACEDGFMTVNQFEAARLLIVRKLKRGDMKNYKIWWRLKATYPYTEKSIGSRMGKGKGKRKNWLIPVRRGKIILELNTKKKKKIYPVLKKLQDKWGIKIKTCTKNKIEQGKEKKGEETAQEK